MKLILAYFHASGSQDIPLVLEKYLGCLRTLFYALPSVFHVAQRKAYKEFARNVGFQALKRSSEKGKIRLARWRGLNARQSK